MKPTKANMKPLEGAESRHLDLLAGDLLDAAAAVLPMGTDSHILGLELAGRASRVAYLVPGPERPRCLTSFPATVDHADVLAAAEQLATALLNARPEDVRIVVGRAMHDGSRLRVHARPLTGEVAAAILHKGQLIEIGRRVIARAATVH